MTEDVRNAVLDVAIDLFAKNGFAKTSMNDIVRASGLSKGGVYWHFKNKSDVIQAVFAQFFDAHLLRLNTLLSETDISATDKLMRLARQGGQELTETASLFPSPLEFYAMAIHDSALQTQLNQFLVDYRKLLTVLINEGITSKEWHHDNPLSVANTLVAVIEGVLLVWVMDAEAFALTEQLEASILLFLRGLKCT